MEMTLNDIIKSVKENQYSYCKFVTPNDAGKTGSHQSGLYIPKNASRLLFDEPGKRGENLERDAKITWQDGVTSICRLHYYGQGTRNEYRITRLGRPFNVNDFIVITKESNTEYFGFVFNNHESVRVFLSEFNLNEEDTNALIEKGGNTNELSFKPRAHILILLGEELIKSPVMAIYELIKNSYDADSPNVEVIFSNIQDTKTAKITIEDKGIGITEDVLKNVWFEPGTDYRKPINQDGIRITNRSPIYNRIPMGEKGVGRFAVHKLGNRIKLITRPSKIIYDLNGNFERQELLGYELIVDIDWRKFSQSKYLEDVSIEWTKNEDDSTFRFKNTSGTHIEITDLKEDWTRGMARQLKRNTISMLSPKNDSNKFRIELDFGNSWLLNIPDSKDLLKLAPYKLSALIDPNYNLTFEYSFDLINNKSIGSRLIDANTKDPLDKGKYQRNIKTELRPLIRSFLERKEYDTEVINELLDNFETTQTLFGTLMIELYSFDLDSISLRDATTSPDSVKELLRDHSGIKVFKGDLRVYDYGDPGNDWLGLDLKRLQNKEWFSNNQNIGYVYLDPASSGSLIEKTNREGFIQNEAYDYFIILLEFLLTEFKSERQSDRERWLRFNKKHQTNFFESRISHFREIIESEDITLPEKKEQLLVEAKRIEEQYDQDKKTLLIPAGVGMTASFAMHEIEKLVPRMQESVNETILNKLKISNQVEELKDYVNGILSVLKKGGDKPVSLIDAINQAINNYSLRLKNRKINIHIENQGSTAEILCDRRLLITILMNILDNSIYWLDTIHRETKQIYFSIYQNAKSTSVLIVDNGPGFKDKTEDIIRPFFSRKEGGIGIGMYLIDTAMIQYGKMNIIHDKDYLKQHGVPEEFTGAAVELMFNIK